MGCCQSTERDPDGDGTHQGGYDGAGGGEAGATTASHTAVASQPGARRPLHSPTSARSQGQPQSSQRSAQQRSGQSSHRSGFPAPFPGPPGQNPANTNERITGPLRQHTWTGRGRPSRSYQGDVSANRKIWTRRSLDKERIAFFETRVSNRTEIWATLRQVVGLVRDHNNVQEAQAILDAAGITVPSGDLADGAYDENGNFYPLVEYVVSDPKDIRAPEPEDDDDDDDDDAEEEKRLAKGKDVDRVPQNAIEVRARLSNRGGPEADVKVNLGKEETVKVLAKRVKQEAGLPESAKVRIVYLGRVLKENRTLEEQGYQKPNMVNALVSDETDT